MTPIARGGLGVVDLNLLNKALLGKWVWRFATEKSAWWRQLIALKCGVGVSEWQLCWNLNATGCSMWRWIAKASSDFWGYGYVDPGGGWVSFWEDFWVSGVNLRALFPRVAAVSFHPLSARLFLFAPSPFRSSWEVPLRVQLRGGALAEWERMVEYLDRLPAGSLSSGPPSLVWPLSTSSIFSVQSFNNRLRLERFPGDRSMPVKTIWSSCVPTKIQGFLWLCYLDRILTIDNLQRRGFYGPNRCSLCYCQEESTNHIFIHCSFSSRVWSKLSSKLSVSGPISENVKGFISGWKGMNCAPPFGMLNKVILHSFFWYLWLERNNRIFRDSSSTTARVSYSIWLACGRWLKAFSLLSQMEFEMWMRAYSDI